MGIEDKVGKWELFEMIVGQKPFQGGCPGDVPDFEIKPKDVDKIYLNVKKMQRCYQDDRPLSEYFSHSFDLVEKAYLQRDFEKFKDAVTLLMTDIDAD